MRMAVKPHQAFFWAARTNHAAGLVPVPPRLPALLLSILSPPPSPHPRLGEGGGERMLLPFTPTQFAWPCGLGESDSGWPACVSVRAPGPNDRLSVWNLPRSQAPPTVYAS